MAENATDLLVLTGEIVSAYVSNNSVRSDDLPGLIRTIRSTLSEDTSPPEPEAQAAPAKLTTGQVRKSITPSGLISFVDGKPYKTLKRHLTRHGMTMKEYQARFGLPNDYPSVAPEYSARRSEMAKSLGLGARGRGAKKVPVVEAPKKRGRKPAAAPAPASES